MKVAICAGGTGGHMFPACALFLAMKEKNHDVTLITDKRGNVFCSDISPKIVLDTVRFSVKNFLYIIWYCMINSIRFCKIWYGNPPEVVIGFGGLFTFLPLVIAKILGAKIVICEQNIVVGKANKLLGTISNLKLSAFDINSGWKKISMPVRKEFKNVSHDYRCDGIIKILVIGGSQGARSFSKIIPGALRKLDKISREKIEIVQQISYGNISDMRALYDSIGVKATLLKFVDNVAEVMSDIQLVICRAGASTLSELVEMTRPAVLIPFPEAADNHQYMNAMYYKERHAAWVVEEGEKSSDELAKILTTILNDRGVLKQMAVNIKKINENSTINDFVALIEQIRKG